MQNDLTFFTNEPGSTLLDRFRKTLRDVRFFDILVGYFRTSGFDKLHESFATIEKIRILVGLNVDRKTFEIIDAYHAQTTLDFETHKRTKEIFSETVTTEMDNSPDSFETELGVKKFIEFLRSGKMEIKAYPTGNLHAKVYISRFSPSTWLSRTGCKNTGPPNSRMSSSADLRAISASCRTSGY